MSQISIHVKNMVCPRCIAAVKNILADLNISFDGVDLGVVYLKHELDADSKAKLEISLQNAGFEMLSDNKNKLVEKVKNEIINLVHHQPEGLKEINLSSYLSEKIGQSYASFSQVFSDVTGNNIEKYYIQQKIEKAKELLSYQELSISEIAYHLNYSSSQHFSRQFKSVTGTTPSQYSKGTHKGRKPLNEI